MASTMRRMSQAPSSHVNLHCSQCDSQIGIFDNEWTRLSSSYVHSVHPGAHFGTEVAMNKTQTVPEGTAQSKLEGCTLAEVFCTKCSGVVGQYCKAIPGPERRTMLKQYLYKLSKTYLRSGDEKVEPIFGYGGYLVRTSTRASATPRLSMPAVPRWSQTPFQQEATPSHLETTADSHRRTSAPMSLQTHREPTPLARQVYEEPVGLAMLESNMQYSRPSPGDQGVAALERRMQANEDHLLAISSILEDIKTDIRELRSQNSMPHVEDPTQIDFVAKLHSMITAMKTAQSNAEELEELRTENASLKAKWDIVQSALTIASGNTASTPSTAASRDRLGKRKRQSDIVDSIAAHASKPGPIPQPSWLGNSLSNKQIPTPQPSTHSDEQSQDASNSSRATSPANVPAEPDVQPSQINNKQTRAKRAAATPPSRKAGKKQRLSEPKPPATVLSPAVRLALVNGSDTVDTSTTTSAIVQHEEHLANPQSMKETLPSVEQNGDTSLSTTQETSNGNTDRQPRPHENDHSTAPDNEGHFQDHDEVPQMDVDTAEVTGNRLPMGESVEFSDDEEARPSSSDDAVLEQHEDQDPRDAREISALDFASRDPVQTRETSLADDASSQSVPAKRTRSKTKTASASVRRNTASFEFVEERSVAPEPPTARRIMPRRLNLSQTGVFEHSTPETVEAELIELEKPKGPRQYKPYKQTTTKILHDELKELGLDDWIDKDKNDPEYKKVVEEARERKREHNRLVALASRGVTVPGANMDDISLASTPSLDDALQQAQALADMTNEKVVPAKIADKTAAAARRAAGVGNGKCRKSKAEREEMIRKNDELAKAAMEMDN